IGVRKAIGAKDRDILRQFLIESLLMSGLGGLAGVAAGVGGAQAFAKFSTTFSTLIEPQSIFLSFGFSVAVGIFFGYYPATRAAHAERRGLRAGDHRPQPRRRRISADREPVAGVFLQQRLARPRVRGKHELQRFDLGAGESLQRIPRRLQRTPRRDRERRAAA